MSKRKLCSKESKLVGVKHRNHTVTRGYLAAWVSSEGGVKGLRYFDLSTREQKFSPSLNARFAITENIYAPIYIDGLRDDRLENWFAEAESELCNFAQNYSTSRPKKSNARVIHHALRSCVVLGQRSEYSIKYARLHLMRTRPELSDEAIYIEVLNNLYNAAQNLFERFRRGTILVLHSSSKPLLTNDQPFWDFTPSSRDFPFACFPLTPSCLMVFFPEMKSVAGDLDLNWQDASKHEVFIDFARKSAMRMARAWVVCPNLEEADGVSEYLTEEKISEASSTDRVLDLELPGLARKLFT